MAGDQPEDQPTVDNFEFYLAEDLKKKQAAQESSGGNRPRKKSLAERAQVKKKMSAMEALREAERLEREKAERAKKEALAKKLAREAAERIAAQRKKEAADRKKEEERKAAEEAEWARKAFGSSQGPGVPVHGARPEDEDSDDEVTMVPPPRSAVQKKEPIPPGLPQDAVVMESFDRVPAAVMSKLMASHQRRAQHQGDLSAAVALGAVSYALEHFSEEVSAHRVVFHDEEWAVWKRGKVLLGAFHPADLYLVGL